MATNTIRLHRVLRATPERTYRAFLDAAALCKWLPPNGFTCTVHQLDAKVGGTHKMSFTNFSSGNSHSFGGRYLELVPGEQEGVPGVIPPEACYLGWQESLDQLARLVDPEIPD